MRLYLRPEGRSFTRYLIKFFRISIFILLKHIVNTRMRRASLLSTERLTSYHISN
ncbi:hypothetical protein SAMN05216419_105413 [Nitrosomonas cryotolerans]|nr:hypothetical protein SAMN05216419_105413 [Nitrosomonas cryotolerans]